MVFIRSNARARPLFIGLLVLFRIFLLRAYDDSITSKLLFVHSIIHFGLNCVRDVIFTVLGNGFPNSLKVRSRSSFLLVNENSLNCTSGLVLLCFFISSSQFLLRPYDVTTTSNLLFVHSFMQFQLNCVRHFWLLVERVFFVHSRD